MVCVFSIQNLSNFNNDTLTIAAATMCFIRSREYNGKSLFPFDATVVLGKNVHMVVRRLFKCYVGAC